MGPRSLGMGQIGTMQTDIWGLHNNVGALGWLKNGGIGIAFDHRYNLQALNQISFSAVSNPGKYGVVAVGASRFGADLFNQTRAMAGWAKTFGIASLGLQAQWYQVAATDFATRHYFILNFGGLAQLTPKLHFGASISNLSQTKASEFQDEKIPTIAKAGLTFLPNNKVKLMAEVQKDLDLDALFRAGLEYEFVEKFFIRTGFTTQTQQISGGFGAEWRNLVFNYAVARHPQLGWTNSLGIHYNFTGKPAETNPSK